MGDEVTIKIQEDGKEIDKTLKAEDVKTLLAEHSELSGKIEKLSDFSKALERYGTDSSTYLSNAEAAFGVMSELVEKGLIDEQGNVIEKKGKGSDSGDKNDLFNFSQAGDNKEMSEKVAQIVSKVVGTKLGDLMKQVENLSSGQAGLFRAQLKGKIQEKYPSFSDNDVSKLFGIASTNPAKDLWAHAEEMAEKQKVSKDKDREKYAKEFGIDLKEFDANKLNEQDSKSGTIAALKGKKFVFSPRAKRLGDKDSVSPRDAMIAHMKAIHKTE